MADKLRSARDVAEGCVCQCGMSMCVSRTNSLVIELEAFARRGAEWMRERAKALGAFHEFDRSPTPGEFDAVSKALKQVMAGIDAIDIGEMNKP